jgi:hypothetical protein
MSIELSDYLVDTLAEAKVLLMAKSDLGRIPLSKKQQSFRTRIEEMIDDWFEKEPNRYRESLLVEFSTSELNLDRTEEPQGSQYDTLNLDGGAVRITPNGLIDADVVTF